MVELLIGNSLKITASVEVGGEEVVPEVSRLRLLSPTGGVSTIPLSGSTAQWTPTSPGLWTVRLETDGPDAATEMRVNVRESRFPNPN